MCLLLGTVIRRECSDWNLCQTKDSQSLNLIGGWKRYMCNCYKSNNLKLLVGGELFEQQ